MSKFRKLYGTKAPITKILVYIVHAGKYNRNDDENFLLVIVRITVWFCFAAHMSGPQFWQQLIGRSRKFSQSKTRKSESSAAKTWQQIQPQYCTPHHTMCVEARSDRQGIRACHSWALRVLQLMICSQSRQPWQGGRNSVDTSALRQSLTRTVA